MEISLDSPHVSRNEIQYRLHFPKTLKKYFLKDTSYVRYDSGLDLRNADIGILAIPMVAAIAPIAWAVGADIRLCEIDATFLQSLVKVKDAYRIFYPNFSFSGDIRAEKTIINKFGGDGTRMLFTGGVDSLTSYLRHRQKKPELFSVWGLGDIPPFEEKFWNTMWTGICSFADGEGVAAFQIKTDMLGNLNRELLSKDFGVSWFSNAAVGLFLLGLCAPATAVRGTGTVIIAASNTEDFKGPPGTHPLIDNNVSWADVRVFHDGYELSRQQKLKYLCKPDNARYLSHLRVCWEWVLNRNCGNCEKCFRTITGLALEGVDPDNCNFDIDETTFPYIMDCFLKGKISLDEDRLFMWRDIQKHIPETVEADISGSREFLTWLRGYVLSQHRANRLCKYIWELNHLYRNKRFKIQYIKRKIRCYYYIAFARLKLFQVYRNEI